MHKNEFFITVNSVLTQAEIAQSAEHEFLNVKVIGSIPTVGEMFFQMVIFFSLPENVIEIFIFPLYSTGAIGKCISARARVTRPLIDTQWSLIRYKN